MSLFTPFLRALALTAALASCAGGALAQTPASYAVVIDTTGFSGSGYLDFSFLPGRDDAPAASAYLSHFGGLFGDLISTDGAVSGTIPGGVNFGNSTGYNDLFQAVSLGGKFSFQVQFGGAWMTTPSGAGTSFDVALIDGSGTSFLGNPNGSVVHFDLVPLNEVGAAGVNGSVSGGIATVSAVPEAPEWMLMVAGVGALAMLRRRRANAAQAN